MSSIKKKCISFIALLMAFVMTVTFSSTTANAADAVTQRMGPYQLSTGISRVNYYITDSVLNHPIGSTLVTLIDRVLIAGLIQVMDIIHYTCIGRIIYIHRI